MKRKKGANILLILGVALVVLSLGILIFSQVRGQKAATDARQLAAQLLQWMPPVQNAAPEDRGNNGMPSMEVQGADFCGILEVPGYNTTLPVGSVWNAGSLYRYPCRFTGSIYDGSLIIGGSDSAGQLDFMKKITGGDWVYVTDMTGNRYRCAVHDVMRTTDVSAEHLQSLDADLVLFARNTYGLDYTLVLCNFG